MEYLSTSFFWMEFLAGSSWQEVPWQEVRRGKNGKSSRGENFLYRTKIAFEGVFGELAVPAWRKEVLKTFPAIGIFFGPGRV